MNIVKKVFSTIAGYDLIRQKETVVLAISGGPDSVAMFHILKEINDVQKCEWRFYIAHLNHCLRGKESDDDEAFVKELAALHKLPFISRRLDITAIKSKQKGSIEEVARNARHDFLKETAIDVKANKIALAHNLDDQAETVLHRIIRGTGLRGLKGISPIRLLSRKHDLFLIRPLIEAERKEIEEYLTANKIPYRTDSTNTNISFTRNRLRHKLIPLIEKEFNPKVKFALFKLGQTAASFYILLREIANEVFENIKMLSSEGEVCISAEEFAKTPPALQTLITDKAVKMLLGKLPQLNFEHYLEVISLCGEEVGNRVVTLPRGLEVKRDAYVLKFYKPRMAEPLPKIAPQQVKIPGKTLIKKLNIQIEAEIMEGKVVGLADYIQKKDFTEEIVDLDKIKKPLKVRLRRKGDVFSPLGTTGTCKLKKFFIDSRIPKDARDKVPILTDDDKIVWVVGYRIANDVKITEKTQRVLKLRISKIK